LRSDTRWDRETGVLASQALSILSRTYPPRGKRQGQKSRKENKQGREKSGGEKKEWGERAFLVSGKKENEGEG